MIAYLCFRLLAIPYRQCLLTILLSDYFTHRHINTHTHINSHTYARTHARTHPHPHTHTRTRTHTIMCLYALFSTLVERALQRVCFLKVSFNVHNLPSCICIVLIHLSECYISHHTVAGCGGGGGGDDGEGTLPPKKLCF